jgi:predicted metal-dependent HD superfamily phosphohydrolase
VTVLPAPLAADLRARYAEPHRRYHTVEHLEEVLASFARLRDLASVPEAVELALWFHDAVYEAAAPAGASEARSAALAVEQLRGAGFEGALVAEVERLVSLTAGHEVAAGDANGAVVADADLAILGAEPARYARYATDVRAEYVHVPDDAWATGRAAVLRGFLARPRLYRTDRAHADLDTAARRNLAHELAALPPIDST